MSILFIFAPLTICAALFERKPAPPRYRKHNLIEVTRID